MAKKIGIIAVVVILVLVLLILASTRVAKSPTQIVSSGPTPSGAALPTGAGPAIPQEMLAGADPLTTRTIQSATSDGRQQLSKIFQSEKTVAGNYNFYLNYLNKNSWQIETKLQTPDLASLFAAKGGQTVSINITKNSITGAVKVDISMVSGR